MERSEFKEIPFALPLIRVIRVIRGSFQRQGERRWVPYNDHLEDIALLGLRDGVTARLRTHQPRLQPVDDAAGEEQFALAVA